MLRKFTDLMYLNERGGIKFGMIVCGSIGGSYGSTAFIFIANPIFLNPKYWKNSYSSIPENCLNFLHNSMGDPTTIESILKVPTIFLIGDVEYM